MRELEGPGYETIASLGRGGMAEVSLARGPDAGFVALKRLLPELARDHEFAAMFAREARLSSPLRHVNITRVEGIFSDARGPCLVLEYVRGWDLSRVLGACARSGGALPARLALYVARELARALGYVHSAAAGEIVHRDVSPANVLLSIDGAVKLTDFGIARAAAQTVVTRAGSLKGKIPYMSPEQVRGDRLDARSDLFSLGVLLFEMSTGRRLFTGESEAALLARVRTASAPAPSHVRPGVPPALDRIVARALTRERDDRFPDAASFEAALEGALGEGGPELAHQLAAFLASIDLPPLVRLPEARAPGALPHAPRAAPLPPTAPGAPGMAEPSPEPPTQTSPSSAGALLADTPAALARDLTSAPPPSPAHAVFAGLRRGVGPRATRPARALVIIAGTLLAATAGYAARAVLARSTPPGSARVEVRTTPPGARVWLDGIERGRAPLVIEGLAREAVELRVDDAGVTVVRRLDLAADADLTVDLALGGEAASKTP